MRKQRKDAVETRRRLLLAAAEVFAQKGFWEATHAEICQKAEANVAAVNYHFGSKENLYIAAWKDSFERSMQAHPPDGGVAPDAPAEERLHGRLLAFMHRVVDPETHEIEIVHKEMANPTGLLHEAMHEVLESERRDTQAVVCELLGDEVDEKTVCLCEMSVMSQCFGPMMRMRRERMSSDAHRPPKPPFEVSVEELADHVTQFSLAGIRGIRENAEKADKNKSKKSGKKERRPRSVSKQE